MPRELSAQAILADQADHVGKVLGSKDILATALKFHLDQVSQTHRGDTLDHQRLPWSSCDQFASDEMDRHSLTDEFPALFVELKPFRDQAICEALERLIEEDIDVVSGSQISMEQDSNPSDDDPGNTLPAHQFTQFPGQVDNRTAPVQEF